ncbi:MAG: hypothetical protein D8H99_44995 [Streptococcus sp.]|nr:MAG: hypothetical protein D8H99_44995 [Streptococcus sp.]
MAPISLASDPNLEHYLCKLYHFFPYPSQALENSSSEKAVILSRNIEITVCSYFNGKPDLTIIGFVNALFSLNYVIMKIRFYYFDQRK